VCAHDEPFYCLSIPFSCLGATVGEIPNFPDAVEAYGRSFDETPLVSKGIDEFGRKRLEVLGPYVETV